MATVIIQQKTLLGMGPYETQRLAVGSLGNRGKMVGHASHIIHQRGNVFEYVMVDALQNIAASCFAVLTFRNKAVVDQAISVATAFNKRTFQSETVGDKGEDRWINRRKGITHGKRGNMKRLV